MWETASLLGDRHLLANSKSAFIIKFRAGLIIKSVYGGGLKRLENTDWFLKWRFLYSV